MSASRLDGCGALVSASCAVHCVVAGAAPVLFAGFGVLHSERFEWALSGTALVFGLLSALVAYRAKRPPWLLMLFVAGIVLVVTGRVAEEALGSGAVAISGGITLAMAHLLQLRMAAKSCRPADEKNQSTQAIAPGPFDLLSD
jgi:hypothetical protein